MPNLEMTADNIGQWARARNLVEGATRKDQLCKLTEEIGELAGGIARQNEEKIVDSIGDAFVVLTILALQSGTDIHACANAAYEEIRHRTGRMVDGIFIKDGE